MIWNDILTAIILGFVGGVIPGPIILLAFSEILKSPKKGLANGTKYILVAGLTEMAVGVFLVVTFSWFKIPQIIFHIFSILGIAMLIYIAAQLFKTKKIDYEKEQKYIGTIGIIFLMILNGSLWAFWLSVCLPIAFHLGNEIKFGEYLFILLFEFSMVIAMTIIFMLFNRLKLYFSNEKIIKRSFFILGLLISLIVLKILIGEVRFWL